MRYQVGDACQLDLAKGAYDVVFSNWLLMYLCDEECAKLAADALSWVTPPDHRAQQHTSRSHTVPRLCPHSVPGGFCSCFAVCRLLSSCKGKLVPVHQQCGCL